MRSWVSHFSAKHLVSLASASVLVLSVAHHQLKFWGLPWPNQLLLAAVAIPTAAFLIVKVLQPVWAQLAGISKKRWIPFLIPAIILAAIISWRVFIPPIVWHTLEIFPPSGEQQPEVQLLEIKDSRGRKVQPSGVRHLGDWLIRDNVFVPAGTGGEPLSHTFYGRIDRPVLLTFATSPSSPEVKVALDGKSTTIDLGGQTGGQRAVELAVGYRFGLGSGVIIALVYLLDFLALFVLFAFFWAIQEIVQPAHTQSHPKAQGATAQHGRNIGILLGIGVALHVVNYLAVPLIVVGDSTVYLNGAVHWLSYYNLDGVPAARGPGMAMLFIPVLWAFGRNAWAVKFFLHVMALACVPLGYSLGWQISGRRWFALLAGLTVVLTPDLYLYSNLVMSDIPNILLGLLFMVLLIQSMKKFEVNWLIAAMIIGSFGVLVRPENILMFAIGVLFLMGKGLWDLKTAKANVSHLTVKDLGLRLGLTTLVGVIPLLWWASHNYRVHGFFDLSNHAGDALHDGWIYFGEASHFSITDPDSQSVQLIASAFLNDPRPADDRDPPTAHWVSTALTNAGYTEQQIKDILVQASIDSILNKPSRSIELLFLKFREGFAPESLGAFTFPFLQEETRLLALKAVYFDEESLNIPWLISVQRAGYQLMDFWYEKGPAQIWIWICLALLPLSLYRLPFFLWAALGIITLVRIMLPTVLSLPHWRYILAGILPLQILALYTLASLALITPVIFQHCQKVQVDASTR
ncbi:MAG: phospholipid carrier-dependent glycosyltransferase [Anaerolineales bacterium]